MAGVYVTKDEMDALVGDMDKEEEKSAIELEKALANNVSKAEEVLTQMLGGKTTTVTTSTPKSVTPQTLLSDLAGQELVSAECFLTSGETTMLFLKKEEAMKLANMASGGDGATNISSVFDTSIATSLEGVMNAIKSKIEEGLLGPL
ncbi:MAG: hypothetical protein AAB653_03850, partial [Patescibacteria group bacterium]